MNTIGQTLQFVNLANEVNISNDISVSNLASGMYLVKTTLGDKVSVRKLIKE
jgi:SLT domain-containing protein